MGISSTEVIQVGPTEGVVLRRLVGRYSARIRNTGTQPVYVGPTGVSRSSGWRLDPGEELPVSTDAPVYAIVDPGLVAAATIAAHTVAVLVEISQ